MALAITEVESAVDASQHAVDFNGETKPLTEDLVNERFCGDVQDMYILAFHVIRINYGGFFGKLGTQSGKVAELAQKLMK